MTREDLKHDIEMVQMIPSLYPSIKESDEQAIINVVEYASEQQRLEEQGLLLKLPCKVGDVVWFVGNKYINDYEVRRFIVDNTGIDAVQVAKAIEGRDYWNSFSICDFGKTVFLTEQEAQSALEKMKGE